MASTPSYSPSYIDRLYDTELLNGNLFPKIDPSYGLNKPYIETFNDARMLQQCISIFPSSDKRGSKLFLIYFHGNSCDIGDCVKRMRMFSVWLGCTVIAIEYSGYGCSIGDKTQDSIIRKCIDSIHYLRTIKNIPLRRMVLFGHSIGCAITTKINSIYKSAFGGIILMSPFLNVKRVAEHHRAASSVLLTDSILSNLNEIKLVKEPQHLLIIHGEKDETIPFDHSETLFKAAPLPETKKFIHLQKNAGHNVFDKESLHWNILLPFFRECEKNCLKPSDRAIKIVIAKPPKTASSHSPSRLRKKQHDVWLSPDGKSCSLDDTIDENRIYKYGISSVMEFLNT